MTADAGDKPVVENKGLTWGTSNEASADDAAFFLGQDAARERAADLSNVNFLLQLNFHSINRD